MTHNLPLALRTAYFAMHRATNNALRPYGITADQFVCIDLLIQKPNITQKELALLASSDPNTISAIIALLKKKDLVSQQTHPLDKRAYNLTVTGKGKSIHNELNTLLHSIRLEMENLFTGNEYTLLHQYLDRISDKLLKQ